MTKSTLLCQRDLEQVVSKDRFSLEAFFYDTIGSTNDEAKLKTRPSILVSLEQTKGRGRLGRTWVSEPGKGLYMSVLLLPHVPIDTLISITQLVGLSVASILGDEAKIKWPNDIYIRGKKICGILCETSLEGPLVEKLIIGIGLNLKPVNVDGRETTSLEEQGMDKSPRDLIEAFLEDFFPRYEKLLEDKSLTYFLEELQNRSYLTGKEVRTPEGKVFTFKGISEKGEAILEASGIETRVLSGELSLKECLCD